MNELARMSVLSRSIWIQPVFLHLRWSLRRSGDVETQRKQEQEGGRKKKKPSLEKKKEGEKGKERGGGCA